MQASSVRRSVTGVLAHHFKVSHLYYDGARSAHLLSIAGRHYKINKVITTMVIRPLNDPT